MVLGRSLKNRGDLTKLSSIEGCVYKCVCVCVVRCYAVFPTAGVQREAAGCITAKTSPQVHQITI